LRRGRLAQVALVGGVVVLGAAAAFFGRDPVPRPVDTPAAITAQPRIAILPFVNLSPDPADAFFADGMHEEIVGTLTTRAPTLDVVPRTTMMTYRAAPESIERVVADLGASHALDGSVRRDGTFVRLTVQLVDGRSQRYLWSRSYDRELGNALSLQSEVASDVASELQITLVRTNGEPAPPTGDSEAYDAYLKARLSFRDGDWVAAADLAAEAIRRDASFGAAYVTRSAASNMQIVFNLDTTEARLEKLRQDLQEAALLLGEDDPVVLAARAMHVAIADRDYDRSFALFATAEAAGLKDTALLRTRAMQLVLTDRLDDAIAAHRSLAALDPGNFVLVNSMAVLLSLAHRPADALRVSNLVVERFPDNNLGHLTRGRLEFAYTGRTASWRAAYEAARPTMTVDQRAMEDFDLLRYENRFEELRRLLDADATAVSAGIFNSLTLCCVGARPLAEYRGWAALLANDADAALRHGREVLDYAANEQSTRWNGWYLQLLRAEGLLLTGADSQAVDAARVSLARVPCSENAINWRYAAAVAARVFAWGGAPEDAITLLEELDAARPGLRPAEITHDPLYRLPLEGQPRYAALQA
jgi:TolB-like protein